jgi:glutamyl/glutaminyl-tRNA synthetase
MRPINTRFNPTTDGDLHLGHLYVAAVNEWVAHSTGGKFILRWDDNQEIWNLRMGHTLQTIIRNGQFQDLEWMGLMPDLVRSDFEWAKEIEKTIEQLDEDHHVLRSLTPMVMVNNSPFCTYTDMVPYPYNAWVTAEKVVADFMDEVGALVRGEDLITESSLYAFLCDIWRIPQPTQYYLGRLLNSDGSELSKTRGGLSIRELRSKGWTRGQIWDVLRTACLKDSRGPWSLDNVLPNPRMSDEALTCGS